VRETRPAKEVVHISEQFQKLDIGGSGVSNVQAPPSQIITPSVSPAATIGSPPAYTASSPSNNILTTNTSPKPVIRRLPVPTPPQPVLRVVKATHDFTPETAEELAFSKGDMVEILDDKLEDPGWWKTRVGGRVGIVPGTYVESI